MPSTRRGFLVTAVAVTSLAGCLGGAPTSSNRTTDADGGDRTGSEHRQTRAAASETTTSETAAGETTAADSTPEPTSGEADQISVSETVDDVDYVPENETVRIVAAYRHTDREAVEDGSGPPEREPVYEEIPWQRWARTECASVAAETVHERLTAEFGDDHGASAGVASEGDGLVVSVRYTVTYDRDGQRVGETSVAFDRLVAATPREVTATVTLDGRTATHTVPTRVRFLERHQQ